MKDVTPLLTHKSYVLHQPIDIKLIGVCCIWPFLVVENDIKPNQSINQSVAIVTDTIPRRPFRRITDLWVTWSQHG